MLNIAREFYDLSRYPVPVVIGNPVGIDQGMLTAIPAITGGIIQTIQTEASKGHPIRVLMYNLYSENGYVNQRMASMIMAVIDLTQYILATKGGEFGAAITESISTLAQMLAGSIALEPGFNMSPYLNQTDIQYARQAAQNLMQLEGLISNFKASRSGGMMPGQIPGVGQFQMNNYAGANNFHSAGAARLAAWSGATGGSTLGQRATFDAGGAGQVFTTAPLQTPVVSNEPTVYERQRPISLGAQAAVVTEQVQETEEVETSEDEAFVPSGKTWTPTPQQPVRVAFDRIYTEEEYVLEDNGVVKQVLKMKEDVVMDENRLRLKSDLELQKRGDSFRYTPNTDHQLKPLEKPFTSLGKPLGIAHDVFAFSEAQAWSVIEAGRFAKGEDESVMDRVVYAFVTKAYPYFTKNTGPDSRSKYEAKNYLGMSLDEFWRLKPSDRWPIELQTELNQVLTDQVNLMLRNKFSLPGTSIESFSEDWLDITKYLSETYGDAFMEMFTMASGDLLIEHMSHLDDVSLASMMSGHEFDKIIKDGGFGRKMGAFAHDYVFVDVISNVRIDISADDATGQLITMKNLPEIATLLNDIAEQNIVNIETPLGIKLRFNKSDVFVIQRGEMMKNAWMITRDI